MTIGCASAPLPATDARTGNASTPAATAAPAEPHAVSGQVRLAGGAPAEGALMALVPLGETGQILRERHGSDYFVIGTTFGTGSLHAYGPKKPGQPPGPRPVDTFTLGPPPPAGLEAALALTEKNLFLLDLRRTSGPVGDWLDSRMSTRCVGGVFRGESNADTRCAPKKSYDALIYIDKVTASHLNPGAN